MEKQSTLVMKFGGTSVGGPEAIAQAAEIVCQARARWPRVVVVTSAMSGVTNLLLDSAARAMQGNMEAVHQAALRLRSQHSAVIAALLPDLARRAQVQQEVNHLISDFTSLCQAIEVLGEATPRALDAVASLGERLSVRLLAAALEGRDLPAQFVEATQLIVTDREFQSAHPDWPASEQRIRQVLNPLLERGLTPVVTGFIGATPEGVITTLGRGGSDYSAAILGATLPADEVWIWTDVDGVMTADPRLVPGARTIPHLSYREIAELAYFGAKVVHPKTIRPVIEAGIPLRVCNTFNPSHPGTCLEADPVSNHSDRQASGNREMVKVVKAVTAIHGQRLITIEGRGMLGVVGVAARTFGAVAATGTSVPLITQASSEQSICFAAPSEAAGRVVEALEAAFSHELERRDIDRVWASDEVVIVTAVGEGMRHIPGVAGRIFGALGERQVNVIAIAQGSSEVSISLVVSAADAGAAVQAIHELIVNSQ
ncbi:MAG TPA: aspartate kinase [Anaerolineales bacterium]